MFHWEEKKRWAGKTSDRFSSFLQGAIALRFERRAERPNSTYTSQIEAWQAMRSQLGGIDGEGAIRDSEASRISSSC